MKDKFIKKKKLNEATFQSISIHAKIHLLIHHLLNLLLEPPLGVTSLEPTLVNV